MALCSAYAGGDIVNVRITNCHAINFRHIGGHLCHFTVYRRFKAVVKEIGMPKERFHDLRHSFAVASIM